MVRPVACQQHQQDMQFQYHDDEGDNCGHHDVCEAPCSPTESDSTSGCSSAAASNCDRDGSPRRRPVQPLNATDQPPAITPSTPSDPGGEASACCGCTGDREGSTRPGDRSVSRGVGYCCTVQPLDGPVTPLTPQPPPALLTSCRDELLLTAQPQLLAPVDRRSPRPQPPPLPPPRRTSLKADRNQ